jgi:hypothetical protein
MSSKDWIGYQTLVDRAFRAVVREALQHVGKGGMMGNHHFYINYDTQAPGVVISDALRSQHPVDLTIVIQNQFWDLKVFDDAFEVGLSFNKMPEVLRIPFAAIKQFSDPSQKFGFQFQSGTALTPATKPAPPPPKPDPESPSGPAPKDPTVVSLDRFRKK